eukprot:324692_1
MNVMRQNAQQLNYYLYDGKYLDCVTQILGLWDIRFQFNKHSSNDPKLHRSTVVFLVPPVFICRSFFIICFRFLFSVLSLSSIARRCTFNARRCTFNAYNPLPIV